MKVTPLNNIETNFLESFKKGYPFALMLRAMIIIVSIWIYLTVDDFIVVVLYRDFAGIFFFALFFAATYFSMKKPNSLYYLRTRLWGAKWHSLVESTWPVIWCILSLWIVLSYKTPMFATGLAAVTIGATLGVTTGEVFYISKKGNR